MMSFIGKSPMQSSEQKLEISDLKVELIRVLDAAAMYNDKGYTWCGHSPAKRAETEAAFHQTMLDLIANIGCNVLDPELVQAVVSGAAARDEVGHFSAIARRKS
ncbi:hypothetical protein [Duganella sp. CF458]|uniref:hypothetical protein n=1 Tax=Duganella sp. CF458 TaxID=1884368 RepID=UPI000B87CDC7|nr:hypothetical protein [Duganella sp. CF458]